MRLTSSISGFLTGILIIITFTIGVRFQRHSFSGDIQYIFYAIYFLGILWTLYNQKMNHPESGFKTYFSEGFKAFVIVTLMVCINMYVFQKMNPQLLDSFIAENNQKIINTKTKTAVEIAENEKTVRKIYIPMILSFTLITYLILGALITSVVGGFLSQLRKDNVKLS